MTNDYSTDASTIETAIGAVYLKKANGNANASKNVVTNSNGEIAFENKTTANLIEASALSNIGISANSSQHDINVAFNNVIGDFLIFMNGSGE